jgi:hypothetical protein
MIKMPAKIRIRCKYIDCQLLDGLFCGKQDEIEFDRKKGCLSYLPVQKDPLEEDLVDEDDLLEEEEEWLELEDEEEDEELEEDTKYDNYEE